MTGGLCRALDISEMPKMLTAPTLNRGYPEADFDTKRAGAAGHDGLDLDRWLDCETMSTYRRLIRQSL